MFSGVHSTPRRFEPALSAAHGIFCLFSRGVTVCPWTKRDLPVSVPGSSYVTVTPPPYPFIIIETGQLCSLPCIILDIPQQTTASVCTCRLFFLPSPYAYMILQDAGLELPIRSANRQCDFRLGILEPDKRLIGPWRILGHQRPTMPIHLSHFQTLRPGPPDFPFSSCPCTGWPSYMYCTPVLFP